MEGPFFSKRRKKTIVLFQEEIKKAVSVSVNGLKEIALSNLFACVHNHKIYGGS